MKKSSVKWIAIGALAAGLIAFSAGMAYAFCKLKKIDADDADPEADEIDAPVEEPNE